MLASFGMGRRIILGPIVDVVGQVVVAAGRVWSVSVSRSWSVELRRTFAFSVTLDRVRWVAVSAREFSISTARSFAAWLKRVFQIKGDE